MGEQFYQTKLWSTLRLQTLQRDKYRCCRCGRAALGKRANGLSPVVDHVVPRSKGGSDTLANLRTLCLPCHNTRTLSPKQQDMGVVVGLDGLPVDGSWS